MNKNDLLTVWQHVERAFHEERINSERALQAILYLALTRVLSPDYLLLVEPSFPSAKALEGFIPDLVILNRVARTVDCFLELKCAPHWWYYERDVEHDLSKLQAYSSLTGSLIEIDVFGPERILDSKGAWIGGRPQYLVTPDTLVGLVVVARSESSVVFRTKLSHPIGSRPNFVLFSGSISPENKTANFTVQW